MRRPHMREVRLRWLDAEAIRYHNNSEGKTDLAICKIQTGALSRSFAERDEMLATAHIRRPLKLAVRME